MRLCKILQSGCWIELTSDKSHAKNTVKELFEHIIIAIFELDTLKNPCAQQAKSRDSAGNPRGRWLLVEGIHAEIWVVSETRIHAEIQGKF